MPSEGVDPPPPKITMITEKMNKLSLNFLMINEHDIPYYDIFLIVDSLAFCSIFKKVLLAILKETGQCLPITFFFTHVVGYC